MIDNIRTALDLKEQLKIVAALGPVSRSWSPSVPTILSDHDLKKIRQNQTTFVPKRRPLEDLFA